MSADVRPGTAHGLDQIQHEETGGFEGLTGRERQVLVLVSDGCSTKEVAARLGITFKTAACHRSRIMAKFGVHNSVGLVRIAIRKGLVES